MIDSRNVLQQRLRFDPTSLALICNVWRGECRMQSRHVGGWHCDDLDSRSEAACIGDVGLQIIRGWVLRFNA
jgi:hypothetical protein